VLSAEALRRDPSRLRRELGALGVGPGAVLLVHCAFSRLRAVAGGPAGLIDGLTEALGPGGTLVMPSMSDDDEHPFDPRTTPCRALGVVADAFWRMPGVLRSDSPHAFAARGPAAARITAPHPPDFPHGPDSPVGRVCELGGAVLLLGVGHDANTTLHLAEALAGVRYRRRKHLTLPGGRRLDYAEIDHCCERFALVDAWLDAAGAQRRGRIGGAEARLAAARALVDTVVPRLRADATLFLHPLGVDPECDEARLSLGKRGR
jgi:aminoglycoside N3'-acetyltransferase